MNVLMIKMNTKYISQALTLKNVEHALCEYDKYYRADTSQPTRDEEEDFDVIN